VISFVGLCADGFRFSPRTTAEVAPRPIERRAAESVIDKSPLTARHDGLCPVQRADRIDFHPHAILVSTQRAECFLAAVFFLLISFAPRR